MRDTGLDAMTLYERDLALLDLNHHHPRFPPTGFRTANGVISRETVTVSIRVFNATRTTYIGNLFDEVATVAPDIIAAEMGGPENPIFVTTVVLPEESFCSDGVTPTGGYQG